ncbi:MAG TPA: SsrA-binding protein SmpB [Polyangia bacterium]|nr:SsrA-binding protein SmpB [Polyangia bacterium]
MEKKNDGKRTIATNRRARRDYEISATVEAGLVLVGTEVKSLRDGKADLKDAYALERGGELFLVGMHITPYGRASHFNHEPRRERKLLLHRREILRLGTRIRERGFTLIPLELYFSGARVKVLLGLARGRKQYDHREAIREREDRRELRASSERSKA